MPITPYTQPVQGEYRSRFVPRPLDTIRAIGQQRLQQREALTENMDILHRSISEVPKAPFDAGFATELATSINERIDNISRNDQNLFDKADALRSVGRELSPTIQALTQRRAAYEADTKALEDLRPGEYRNLAQREILSRYQPLSQEAIASGNHVPRSSVAFAEEPEDIIEVIKKAAELVDPVRSDLGLTPVQFGMLREGHIDTVPADAIARLVGRAFTTGELGTYYKDFTRLTMKHNPQKLIEMGFSPEEIESNPQEVAQAFLFGRETEDGQQQRGLITNYIEDAVLAKARSIPTTNHRRNPMVQSADSRAADRREKITAPFLAVTREGTMRNASPIPQGVSFQEFETTKREEIAKLESGIARAESLGNEREAARLRSKLSQERMTFQRGRDMMEDFYENNKDIDPAAVQIAQHKLDRVPVPEGLSFEQAQTIRKAIQSGQGERGAASAIEEVSPESNIDLVLNEGMEYATAYRQEWKNMNRSGREITNRLNKYIENFEDSGIPVSAITMPENLATPLVEIALTSPETTGVSWYDAEFNPIEDQGDFPNRDNIDKTGDREISLLQHPRTGDHLLSVREKDGESYYMGIGADTFVAPQLGERFRLMAESSPDGITRNVLMDAALHFTLPQVMSDLGDLRPGNEPRPVNLNGENALKYETVDGEEIEARITAVELEEGGPIEYRLVDNDGNYMRYNTKNEDGTYTKGDIIGMSNISSIVRHALASKAATISRRGDN